MDDTAADALQRLRAAAADGRLREACHRHGIELVVVFGSALRSPSPRDLDVAIRFTDYGADRVLAAIDALAELVGPGRLDVVVLNTAGVVVREEALVHGEGLFEATDDLHARQQIAATMERLDTDHLRRRHLDSLARGGR